MPDPRTEADVKVEPRPLGWLFGGGASSLGSALVVGGRTRGLGMSEHAVENDDMRWDRGWRIGPQRWDWLRSIRCALNGHQWAVNARRTQRCCGRCWMVQNSKEARRG